MGDTTSRFRLTFDILLFYLQEIQSLCLSDDDPLLRRSHIMGVIRKFRDEQNSLYGELLRKFDGLDSQMSTDGDVYETAAAALYLLLDDVDTADDACKEQDTFFIRKVGEIVKNGDAIHTDGVPHKIIITREYYCKITRLDEQE